jgi:hypothetical protein
MNSSIRQKPLNERAGQHCCETSAGGLGSELGSEARGPDVGERPSGVEVVISRKMALVKLRKRFDDKLQVLTSGCAGERLRGLMRQPSKLNGKAKVGEP